MTARRPRTCSGEISLPRARSSSSVSKGHLSVWLRLDFSFFSIPPPGFRSLWFVSAPVFASVCPLLNFCAGFLREPLIPDTRAIIKRVVVLLNFRATSQTTGVISRWRKMCTGHGKVRLWLADSDGGCHSYRRGMNGLHPSASRFLFPTGCYKKARIRPFWAICEASFFIRFDLWNGINIHCICHK